MVDKLIGLKLHSYVDVITNSSTTIYSYFDGSVNIAKEMVDCFLKSFKIDMSPDDMFYFGVANSIEAYTNFNEKFEWERSKNNEDYKNYYIKELDKLEKLKYAEKYDYIKNIIRDIITEKISKPQWMVDVDKLYKDSNYATIGNVLYIIPKKDEYNDLANFILKFIYSPEYIEGES